MSQSNETVNKLERFFFESKLKHGVHKWVHYLDIYDRHFRKFQGKKPVILEIGVENGGSLDMWNDYFDNDCVIYGLDINPSCKALEKDSKNVQIILGSQSSPETLDYIIKNVPPIDILIDDGSHINDDLKTTFDALYNHVKPGGVYLIEDLHTCYWAEYGGGLNNPRSFIEQTKPLIDQLNNVYFRENAGAVDPKFATTLQSMHYYDSILVVEKHSNYRPPRAVIRQPSSV
jgi:hypothetical protein